MKKFGLLALSFFLVLSFGSVVKGQTSQVSADVGVAAEVLQALDISVTDTISFGVIETDAGETHLDPEGSLPNTDAQYGVATITGTENQEVTITVTEVPLSDGTNSITYTPEVSVSNGTTSGYLQTGGNSQGGGDDTGTMTLGASNSLTIGGYLPSISNAGIYQGSSTITVDYN